MGVMSEALQMGINMINGGKMAHYSIFKIINMYRIADWSFKKCDVYPLAPEILTQPEAQEVDLNKL